MEEAAIEPSELFLVDELSGAGVSGGRAAEGAQLALDALADKRSFVGLLGGFFESGFDVAVGDAAGAQVACDAECALGAGFGGVAGERLGVTGVGPWSGAFEAR